MTSNQPNVYARVVHGLSTTASTYFSCPQDTAIPPNQFCGELGYTGKTTSLTATVGDSFLIGEAGGSLNPGEYTGVNSYKTGGDSKFRGNYGVAYDLNFSNAANKKLVITPNWSSATAARILIWTPSLGWYSTNKITSGSWSVNLGTNYNSNVKIIIPGGNHGNINCAFSY
ncbi:MAG: hypothetical protein RO469_16590 [Thermincola sp.]|jgi:hypothetical protein|nr:hypothetical protein [Thermincola sp.]MDT3703243.1 hypothetical protein [Thermincola sp.]